MSRFHGNCGVNGFLEVLPREFSLPRNALGKLGYNLVKWLTAPNSKMRRHGHRLSSQPSSQDITLTTSIEYLQNPGFPRNRGVSDAGSDINLLVIRFVGHRNIEDFRTIRHRNRIDQSQEHHHVRTTSRDFPVLSWWRRISEPQRLSTSADGHVR